jgi:hypothetical protein
MQIFIETDVLYNHQFVFLLSSDEIKQKKSILEMFLINNRLSSSRVKGELVHTLIKIPSGYFQV